MIKDGSGYTYTFDGEGRLTLASGMRRQRPARRKKIRGHLLRYNEYVNYGTLWDLHVQMERDFYATGTVPWLGVDEHGHLIGLLMTIPKPNPNYDPNSPDSSPYMLSALMPILDLGPLETTVTFNTSWTTTFVKTFFTVPYRKPGEKFTACWNRAASDTLVGMGVPREATPGTEALLGSAGTVGLFSSVKSIWALGNWVRPSSYLSRRILGPGSPLGSKVARISGKAMAASLAAEVGLRTGAALDCAIPVN